MHKRQPAKVINVGSIHKKWDKIYCSDSGDKATASAEICNSFLISCSLISICHGVYLSVNIVVSSAIYTLVIITGLFISEN